MCTISRRGSGSHRVGFLGQNYPRPGPAQPAEGRRDRGKEGARDRGRLAGAWGEAAGRAGAPGSRPGGVATCGLSAPPASRGRTPAASPGGQHSPRLRSSRRRRQGARGTPCCPLCLSPAPPACPPRPPRAAPPEPTGGTRFRPAGPARLHFRPLAPSCAPPGLWCFMYSGPDESEVR